MATPIPLPALSPTMKEGKILKWLKNEGDKVSSGEAIAEVETDKSNLEVEAYDDGVLLKIVVAAGEMAAVGAPIAVLGAKGETVDLASLAPATPAAVPAPPAGAPRPAESPAAAPPRAAAPPALPAAPARAPAPVVPLRPPAAAGGDGRLRASPLARKMAQEAGVDLGAVHGSGPRGRIVKRDVQAAMSGPRAPVFVPGVRPEPDIVPLSSMRKVIAQRMAEVKPGVPHFYLSIEVDMEAVVAVREEAKAAEVKVSVNDFILKAAALALHRVPKVNVSLQGDRILQFHTADVGIAVAIEDGLITPVVRDADQKSIGQLAAEARELAERARRKALRPEEYSGGSVTVSNLGMYGVDAFIAVINPPQASILAVGTVAERVVARGGQPVVRKTMTMTFSGDHRVGDGALGAQYLEEVKELLEHPVRLLF